MTIFNNLPVEVENHIFTFSTFRDLVVCSGINKAAYTRLDNEGFFGKIFKERHPNYESLLEPTQVMSPPRKIDYYIAKMSFWEKHTNNNGWKVVCCVFQTGQLNFSKSFINEVVFHMQHLLKAEEEEFRTDLKWICGTGVEDPDSPIEQAWLAHEKTKSLLGVELSRDKKIIREELQSIWVWVSCKEFHGDWEVVELEPYFNEIIGDRMEEFIALEQENEIGDENTLSTWLAFDERFAPVVNYFRYLILDGKRLGITDSIEEIGDNHKYIEDLKQKIAQKDPVPFVYDIEKQALSLYFENLLFAHFLSFFDKDTAMTEKDRQDLCPAFKAYVNCLSSQGKEIQLHTINNKINHFCKNEDKISLSNRNEALQILDAETIREEIESYAKQPLTPGMVMGFSNRAYEIRNLWANRSTTLDSIHEKLIHAIIKEHKDQLLLGKNQEKSVDQIPSADLRTILFTYTFVASVEHFAEQPIASLGAEYFNANTVEILKRFRSFSPQNNKNMIVGSFNLFFNEINRFTALPLEAINPEIFKSRIEAKQNMFRFIQKLLPGKLNIKGIILKAIQEKHGPEGVKRALGQ